MLADQKLETVTSKSSSNSTNWILRENHEPVIEELKKSFPNWCAYIGRLAADNPKYLLEDEFTPSLAERVLLALHIMEIAFIRESLERPDIEVQYSRLRETLSDAIKKRKFRRMKPKGPWNFPHFGNDTLYGYLELAGKEWSHQGPAPRGAALSDWAHILLTVVEHANLKSKISLISRQCAKLRQVITGQEISNKALKDRLRVLREGVFRTIGALQDDEDWGEYSVISRSEHSGDAWGQGISSKDAGAEENEASVTEMGEDMESGVKARINGWLEGIEDEHGANANDEHQADHIDIQHHTNDVDTENQANDDDVKSQADSTNINHTSSIDIADQGNIISGKHHAKKTGVKSQAESLDFESQPNGSDVKLQSENIDKRSQADNIEIKPLATLEKSWYARKRRFLNRF